MERTLSVAVVTYNSAPLLPSFLHSLDAAVEDVRCWQLVVVDNCSDDDSIAICRRHRPDALVVQLDRNAGYAAGVNAAWAAAPADALLVVNPDVRLAAGSATALLAAIDPPRTAISVPRLVDGGGALEPSLRREPRLLRAWGEALLGGERSGRWSGLGELVMDDDVYRRPTEAAWATGAAMMISRECLDRVGPWDESFFLYSEDTDFCLRAADEGFGLRLVPDSLAVHLGGDRATSPRLYALAAVNRLVLYRRRHGHRRTLLFWGALVTNEALRSWRSPTHRAALRALIRALLR